MTTTVAIDRKVIQTANSVVSRHTVQRTQGGDSISLGADRWPALVHPVMYAELEGRLAPNQHPKYVQYALYLPFDTNAVRNAFECARLQCIACVRQTLVGMAHLPL